MKPLFLMGPGEKRQHTREAAKAKANKKRGLNLTANDTRQIRRANLRKLQKQMGMTATQKAQLNPDLIKNRKLRECQEQAEE